LDAYSFTPCGYSANALIRWSDNPVDDSHNGDAREPQTHEGYYNIHVTPENGWSYASFECNVPVPNSPSANARDDLPELTTLVRRVVDIFQPGRLSLTLFISSSNINNDEDGKTGADAAQRAFKSALTTPTTPRDPSQRAVLYKRTDKINYEFGGYDLAFASFEVRP
jgi:S-adenosylmethionine decarboxylase